MRHRVLLEQPTEPLTSTSEVEDAVYEWQTEKFADYPEGRGAKDIPELLSRFAGVKFVASGRPRRVHVCDAIQT